MTTEYLVQRLDDLRMFLIFVSFFSTLFFAKSWFQLWISGAGSRKLVWIYLAGVVLSVLVALVAMLIPTPSEWGKF